jgi:divalent anion:Na+ symporter, DASS family
VNPIFNFLIPIAVGLGLYNTSAPSGMDAQGWHLFAIFVATIVGVVFKPLPMGAVALIGMAATVLTGTLKLQPEALSGFSDGIVWLILYVYFIARGFIKTKLGIRIAYKFVQWFGHSALGLGYSVLATELFISPFIPSSAARAGGIMYPVVTAISESMGSHAHDSTRRKIGAYLYKLAYNGNLITSSMFLTAMAANPMCQSFAASQGVQITWGNWAMAAAVPGMLSLIVLPLFLYFVFPPSQKRFAHAPELARQKLAEMGPMSSQEWLMGSVFTVMLGLWIFGESYGISAVTTALLGLSLLLLTQTVTWDDVLNEKEAWHTMIWFSILVTMAKYLQVYGVIAWFSAMVSTLVMGMGWMSAFAVLILIYFYSHYLFASNTSHVSAMYAAFLAVAISVGTPPLLAALAFGFSSSIFSSMTHYGASTSALFFGAGYIDIGTWWRLGFMISVVNVLIWFGIGGAWWKVLGLW